VEKLLETSRDRDLESRETFLQKLFIQIVYANAR